MAVNLINVGLLVAGVLFVLWFYHAQQLPGGSACVRVAPCMGGGEVHRPDHLVLVAVPIGDGLSSER